MIRILIASLIPVTVTAPVLAFDFPSPSDFAQQLATEPVDEVMVDVSFFHELRIRNSPNGYESEQEFSKGAREASSAVWSMGTENVTTRLLNTDQSAITSYLEEARAALASNQSAFDSFLSSQGVEPNGEVAQDFLDSLLKYGVIYGISTGSGDFSAAREFTYIWPFCMPVNPASQ